MLRTRLRGQIGTARTSSYRIREDGITIEQSS
jgi:hypothetical protein